MGCLYLASALCSALAAGWVSFALARLVGSISVGIATTASPIYVAEISSVHLRGRLTGLFQLNIVFGILAALLSNSLLGWLVAVDVAWRWMLAVMAVPSVLYMLACLGIPESPRWLVGVASCIAQNADRTPRETLEERLE